MSRRNNRNRKNANTPKKATQNTKTTTTTTTTKTLNIPKRNRRGKNRSRNRGVNFSGKEMLSLPGGWKTNELNMFPINPCYWLGLQAQTRMKIRAMFKPKYIRIRYTPSANSETKGLIYVCSWATGNAIDASNMNSLESVMTQKGMAYPVRYKFTHNVKLYSHQAWYRTAGAMTPEECPCMFGIFSDTSEAFEGNFTIEYGFQVKQFQSESIAFLSTYKEVSGETELRGFLSTLLLGLSNVALSLVKVGVSKLATKLIQRDRKKALSGDTNGFTEQFTYNGEAVDLPPGGYQVWANTYNVTTSDSTNTIQGTIKNAKLEIYSMFDGDKKAPIIADAGDLVNWPIVTGAREWPSNKGHYIAFTASTIDGQTFLEAKPFFWGHIENYRPQLDGQFLYKLVDLKDAILNTQENLTYNNGEESAFDRWSQYNISAVGPCTIKPSSGNSSFKQWEAKGYDVRNCPGYRAELVVTTGDSDTDTVVRSIAYWSDGAYFNTPDVSKRGNDNQQIGTVEIKSSQLGLPYNVVTSEPFNLKGVKISGRGPFMVTTSKGTNVLSLEELVEYAAENDIRNRYIRIVDIPTKQVTWEVTASEEDKTQLAVEEWAEKDASVTYMLSKYGVVPLVKALIVQGDPTERNELYDWLDVYKDKMPDVANDVQAINYVVSYGAETIIYEATAEYPYSMVGQPGLELVYPPDASPSDESWFPEVRIVSSTSTFQADGMKHIVIADAQAMLEVIGTSATESWVLSELELEQPILISLLFNTTTDVAQATAQAVRDSAYHDGEWSFSEAVYATPIGRVNCDIDRDGFIDGSTGTLPALLNVTKEVGNSKSTFIIDLRRYKHISGMFKAISAKHVIRRENDVFTTLDISGTMTEIIEQYHIYGLAN